MKPLYQVQIIPFVLLFLLIFYSLIISLSSGLIGVAVLLLSLSYIIGVGVLSRKPELSVFLFLFATLFIPQGKSYNGTLFSYDSWRITPFLFSQVVAAIPIIIQALRQKKYTFIKPKPRTLLHLFTVTLVLYVLYEVVLLVFNAVAKNNFAVSPFAYYIEFSGAIVFFYGCLTFIKTSRQVNLILLLMLAASIEMGLESYLYGILQLQLPRAANVINVDFENKFVSLIYGDYAKLPYIQYAGVSISVYFFLKRKNLLFLLLIPLQILPLILTYQRTPLISVGLILLVTFFFVGKSRVLKVLIASFCVLIAVFFENIVTFLISSQIVDITQFKVNYFVVDQALGSGVERVGLALRGVEIFISNFPFGIGADYDRFTEFMISKDVPTYFKQFLLNYIPKASVYYIEITTIGTRTDTHNFFAFFLVQYGILGLLILCQLFRLIIEEFLNFRKTLTFKESQPRIYFYKLVCFIFLFASFFSFFFQSAIPYTIVLFFFFLLTFNEAGDSADITSASR